MQISETILLLLAAVITGVAALFCIISLATSQWSSLGTGLFCSGCPSASAGLSIVAFLCLLVGTVVLLFSAFRKLPNKLRVLCLFILFLASIFTLSCYAAYFDSVTGYSYRLMVVAHVFCYIASILIAFWLGGSYGATISTGSQT